MKTILIFVGLKLVEILFFALLVGFLFLVDKYLVFKIIWYVLGGIALLVVIVLNWEIAKDLEKKWFRGRNK